MSRSPTNTSGNTSGNISGASTSADVVVSVTIAARPETVFRFFSDPERFQAWIGHGSTIRPGKDGAFTIASTMGPPASGRIVEWQDDRRVVFTWGHPEGSGGLPPESSRVEVLLEPVPGGTRVTLRHLDLPSEQARQGTSLGWRYHLGTLSLRAHADALEGRLGETMDTWFRAWNETDPAARAALVERCFAEDGVFRDRFGIVTGREQLNLVIGMAQAMSHGAQIEGAGAPELCHASARAPWRIKVPGGPVVATGTNYCELDAEARIKSAVGFWDAAPRG